MERETKTRVIVLDQMLGWLLPPWLHLSGPRFLINVSSSFLLTPWAMLPRPHLSLSLGVSPSTLSAAMVGSVRGLFQSPALPPVCLHAVASSVVVIDRRQRRRTPTPCACPQYGFTHCMPLATEPCTSNLKSTRGSIARSILAVYIKLKKC